MLALAADFQGDIYLGGETLLYSEKYLRIVIAF